MKNFIPLTLLVLSFFLSSCGGGSTSDTSEDGTSTTIVDNSGTTSDGTINDEGTQTNVDSSVVSEECQLATITDDSGFTDSYPANNIPWSVTGETVSDIAAAFNAARMQDSTITQELVMPSQEVWDSMDAQEQALFLLNNERYFRGIKPYEGITQDIVDVATDYAQYLYDTDAFGHTEDGTPVERLDRKPRIANNRDFFRYSENLYAHADTTDYIKNALVKAIYGFIYNDEGSAWGHRDFCLANDLNDNSGEAGKEGLIGFGIKTGEAYEYFGSGYKNTIVVMNGIDPSSSWDHSDTISVPFCTATSETTPDQNASAQRFVPDIAKGTVEDTATGLYWQNSNLSHSERADAIAYCDALDFAGYSDWRLPTVAEAKEFHYEMNLQGITPTQLFESCTAEVDTDGYVRTKKGAETYGGNPGDSINFTGGANVRCVRG